MIVALLSVMNRRTAPSGRVAACGATSANSTAPTTVIEPIATNTASASRLSEVSSPACAIDAEAATVSARFFGFAAESAMPSTSARAHETDAMLAIHEGIPGCSPGFGRFRHCRAAITRNARPIARK